MKFLGKKKAPQPPRRPVVRGHTYEDDLLDAAEAELQEGKLQPAITVLVDSRNDPESRQLRLGVLSDGLIGHADEIAELAVQHRDPELMLLAGDAMIGEAWAIRGSGWASSVSDDQRKLYKATLKKSVGLLHTAADMLPDDAAPWAVLLGVGMGMGVDRSEQDAIWAETIKRAPTLFPAHWTRVQVLAEKWYGSHQEMMEFAIKTVNTAPPGDPVTAMLIVAFFEMYLQIKTKAVNEYERPDLWGLAEHTFKKRFDDIQAASNRWLQAERPHARTFEAHNYFAAAAGLAGDGDRAFVHLAGMRDRLSRSPWDMLDNDPEEPYQRMVAKYWRTSV